MLFHFIRYIAAAIAKMPQLVGSNWGGLAFAVFLFLVTEAVLWKWGEMKTRWGRNTLIGFAIAVIGWALLFLVAATLTMYDDHQNLVGASARIKGSLQGQIKNTRSELTSKLQTSQNELSGTKLQCAREQGRNDILDYENRKKQTSIDSCLTQAIKLITPPAPYVHPFKISELERPGQKMVSWAFTTNTTHAKLDIVATCNVPILELDAAPGGGIVTSSRSVIAANIQRLTIMTPVWTPEEALIADVRVDSRYANLNVNCSFNVQDVR